MSRDGDAHWIGLPVRGVPPASHEMAAAGGAVCKGSSLAALAPRGDGLLVGGIILLTWLRVLFGLISLLIIAGIAVSAWLVPRRGL